jgi:D-alanyl-D-alanine carboxypeptidase
MIDSLSAMRTFFIRKPLLLGFAAALLSARPAEAQASVIAVDLYNKKVHIGSGLDVKRPVGGLAKIATTLVALDWSEITKVNLNVLATVSPNAIQISGYNGLNLQPGDQITLRDLIYASMMTSDNLASTALAEFVGGDILRRLGKGSDPIVEFVSQMNKLAAREGMAHTRFTNPHGFENSRTVPYSTAADMAKLTLYALTRAPFRFYTNQKTRDIVVFRGGQRMSIPLQNTNSLLGVSNIDGVKTGNTPQSGGCVIISEERHGTVMKQADGQDVVYRHRMIAIVIGSAEPFTEAQNLLRNGWNAYDNWLRQGRPITDRMQLLSSY